MRAAADQMFSDRSHAGRRLAELLQNRDWQDPVVLGLARGGIPVAAEVADELGAPLDVMVARKIGAPARPEFGIGAVTPEGPVTYDESSVRLLGLGRADLDNASDRERGEARRRFERYRQGRDAERIEGRDAVIVDDGLATGVTATASVRAVREGNPRSLVLAIPVCAQQAATALRHEADEVVCASEPEVFQAVGQWYSDFSQTTDDDVVAVLNERGAR